MKQRINDLSISKESTLKDALHKMDSIGRKLLIILDDDGKFYSLISIGDIQRSIISNMGLNTSLKKVLRSNISVATEDEDIDKIKKRMLVRRNEFMPIISSEGKILKIIFWEELFESSLPKSNKKCDIPVVIMAGGEGRRLKPLTNVLPKPLLPIGEKTVIEIIMDKFLELGSNRFYISLNYKADLIEYYLNGLQNNKYSIQYLKEFNPLGTAGSLHLLKGKIGQTFFITNCDILIDQDYSEILDYHNDNKNEITIVSAIKSISIPYGVLKTSKNSTLKEISEKPEFTININTGFYVLEPGLINEIPEHAFFHITWLIDKVIDRKGRIGVFPISDGSWTDIGNWDEYLTFLKRLNNSQD